MNQSPAAAAPCADFKDRRTGLVVFGVLSIFIGCICALLVPVMFFAQAWSARTAGQAADYRMLLPALMMYGAMAVAFVWLGIGSISYRRWARALLLVLAWLWLLLGIGDTAFAALFLPQLLAASEPNGATLSGDIRTVVTIFVVLVTAAIFVALPGAFVLFYRSRHVKATCEARDPVTRWTDRSPLPVLALSLALAFSPPALLTMLVAYNSVVPWFGHLVTGPPATALLIALAVACAYGAWATYRLKVLGWWVVTVAFTALSLSAVLTFGRVGIGDMYQAMGYSAGDVEIMRGLSFLRGSTLAAMTALVMAPFIAYLVWMKRYFR